uniref:RNA methyltransferase n=1 Tax=Graphocephala atropunctata TaxID=36148 RepID=A0A1B6KR85_9HEMI
MEESDLNCNNKCAGSARYGNFNNYYNFHPVENRVRLLPKYMNYVNKDQGNVVCLDVGCNTGDLTQALQKHVTKNFKSNEEDVNCQILAIDLDQDLIAKATAANENEKISFFCVDILTNDFQQLCSSFLEQHKRKTFDIVFCFSVTMWIHINYGDEGLKQFLVRLSEIADLLVVEPQPWKCYGRAVRRTKRANSEPFAEYSGLKIRKDVESFIDNFLIKECNLVRVLQSAPTSWGRQVNFYKNNQRSS